VCPPAERDVPLKETAGTLAAFLLTEKNIMLTLKKMNGTLTEITGTCSATTRTFTDTIVTVFDTIGPLAGIAGTTADASVTSADISGPLAETVVPEAATLCTTAAMSITMPETGVNENIGTLLITPKEYKTRRISVAEKFGKVTEAMLAFIYLKAIVCFVGFTL